MKIITIIFTLAFAGTILAQNDTSVKNANGAGIVINEIDVDQESTDTLEFIELFSSTPNTSLNGLVIVLFNGNDDASYNAIDLEGFTTDSDGYFIIGGNAIVDADITIGTNNVIQNGPDAVGLYFGSEADFPTDTPATATNLQMALVYGTSDADDIELLAALEETVQYDENSNGMKDFESIQRNLDGSYCARTPTPRAENIDCSATCLLSVFVLSNVCDAITTGVDTYTTTLGFTDGGTATYTINTTEGTVSGDDPSTVSNGTIIISNVDEGLSFDYNITSENCNITNTINAETCVPATIVTNLAALRAGVIGQEYTLSGEVILTFQQNFRNQKFIEDATAAILIDDVNGNITSTYTIGDGLTGISGFLASFNGMLQFSITTDPGAATSANNTPTPQSLTFAQLIANPNDYEAELVRLEIINIDTSINTEWFTGTEYVMQEFSTNDEYIFRTSFFDTDYIGTEVVSGFFQVYTGIITERGNGNFFFTSRSLADFKLLGVDKNNILGFTVTPNPASSQVTFSTVSSEILNVAIYDVAGKQVMNIANAQGSVDVSNLATGLYVVRATENGQTSIAKLVIE